MGLPDGQNSFTIGLAILGVNESKDPLTHSVVWVKNKIKKNTF